MTNPGFIVGAKVALVHYNWSRRITQREIGKVHKTGRFFLKEADGSISNVSWTPGTYNNNARRSGDRKYINDHIELWTAEHDQEIINNRSEDECRKLAEQIKAFAIKSNPRDPADCAKLKEIKAILFPAAT